MRGFEDHFALGSELYAKARPCYPMALSAWLTEQAPRSKLAWDAGTGSGRLAHQLNSHFDRVYATDASQAQLDQATPAPGLEFALERAEQSMISCGFYVCSMIFSTLVMIVIHFLCLFYDFLLFCQ